MTVPAGGDGHIGSPATALAKGHLKVFSDMTIRWDLRTHRGDQGTAAGGVSPRMQKGGNCRNSMISPKGVPLRNKQTNRIPVPNTAGILQESCSIPAGILQEYCSAPPLLDGGQNGTLFGGHDYAPQTGTLFDSSHTGTLHLVI